MPPNSPSSILKLILRGSLDRLCRDTLQSTFFLICSYSTCFNLFNYRSLTPSFSAA
jgi:hypothetical protein